jgi:hypothetical protein
VMQEREPRLQDAVGIFAKDFDTAVAPQLKQLQAQGLKDRNEEEKQRSKIIAEAIPAQLAKDFEAAFQEVYKQKTSTEKRGAIAWLLLNLSEVLKDDEKKAPATVLDSEAWARTLKIIGQNAMIEQMERQVSVFQAMAYECDRTMERERDLFVKEHHARLLHVLDLQANLESLQRLTATAQLNVKVEELLIKEQEAEIDKVEVKLRAARAETARLLEKKSAMENEILVQQRQLREAIENIQQLASDLRKLEEQFPRREAEPR